MAQSRTKRKSDATPSVDEVIVGLENVVRELERGELNLEESLARFEEGVRLSRQGHALLGALEQRVERLLDDGEGRVPFAEEGDDGASDDQDD